MLAGRLQSAGIFVHLFMLIFLSQQGSQSLSLVAPGESILLSCENWLECRTQSPVPYHPSDPKQQRVHRFTVSPSDGRLLNYLVRCGQQSTMMPGDGGGLQAGRGSMSLILEFEEASASVSRLAVHG